jgi:hypothetical protein
MEAKAPAVTPPLAGAGVGEQAHHSLPRIGRSSRLALRRSSHPWCPLSATRGVGRGSPAAGRPLPDVGNPLPAHLQTVSLSDPSFRQEHGVKCEKRRRHCQRRIPNHLGHRDTEENPWTSGSDRTRKHWQ